MSSKAPKTQLSNRQAMFTRATPPQPNDPDDPRPYIMGAVGGLLSGLFAAFIFKRAAGEAVKDGDTNKVDTGQLFTLVFAVVTLLRQIAELAHPPKKKK